MSSFLPSSAYIHIPFCSHRCGYCNFSLIAGRAELVSEYLKCLEIELSRSLSSPQSVTTVFIGGGTPTFLQPQELEQMLALVNHWLPLEPGGEFTCEANPLDCNVERLSLLRAAGVNRLSLGGQSFNDSKLKILERDHTAIQLREVTERASDYFDNLSLDLIFAAPGETLSDWQADLDSALQLPLQHLSTYGLTIERGSKFFGRVTRGELVEIDDDLQLAMYEHTIDRLQELNWQHYEVSNFCKPTARCRHNLNYWNGKCWWAFGAGASSFLLTNQADLFHTEPVMAPIESLSQQALGSQNSSIRWQLCTNHRSTTQYVKLVRQGKSPVAERDILNWEAWIRQRLVFGLRQLDGVEIAELDRSCGRTVRWLFEPYLSHYLDHHWLELNHGRLRLTRSGLMISDSLWPDLLTTS